MGIEEVILEWKMKKTSNVIEYSTDPSEIAGKTLFNFSNYVIGFSDTGTYLKIFSNTRVKNGNERKTLIDKKTREHIVFTYDVSTLFDLTVSDSLLK